MVDAGRLIAQATDRATLANVVEAAERDVLAADANLATFSPWADAMFYEAGLRAARVIVQAGGHRIDAGAGAHATAIDAADALTGGGSPHGIRQAASDAASGKRVYVRDRE